MDRTNARNCLPGVVGAIAVAFAATIAFLEPNLRGTMSAEWPANVKPRTIDGIQEGFGWPTTYLYTEFGRAEFDEALESMVTYWGGILFFGNRSVILLRRDMLLFNIGLSILFVAGAAAATYQYLHRTGMKLRFSVKTFLAAVGVFATYLALGIDLEYISRYILPMIRFSSIVALWIVATSLLMLLLEQGTRRRST